jgi:hypothetical protein
MRLVALAAENRRYGLARLTVLLRREGIIDNHKRIGPSIERRIFKFASGYAETRSGTRADYRSSTFTERTMVARFRPRSLAQQSTVSRARSW